MKKCRVSEETNAYIKAQNWEVSEELEFQSRVTGYILENILTDARELSCHTELSIDEAQAVVDLYQSLPMKNGVPMTFGASKVERNAWNLIKITYVECDHIRDIAENKVGF